jgi:hypothetical protein
METDHRNEVIRRAAQCLADDPTFRLLPGPQQFAEAEAVLAREKGVDPNDGELVADVLLAAVEAQPTPPAPPPPPRAHIPVGKPAEAVTALVDAQEDLRRRFEAIGGMGPEAPAAIEPPVFTPAPQRGKGPHAYVEKAPRPVNDMPLLKLYKEATGASDAVVAHVVMIPRSTVQAICAGRVHETLDVRQRHALRQSLEAQKMKIDAAIAAI